MSDAELQELSYAATLSSMNELHFSERKHLAGILSRMLRATDKARAKELRDTIIRLYARSPGFARKLRRAMYDRGYTAAKLSREVGIGRPQISALLSGKYRPLPQTIDRIAWALKMGHELLEDPPK